MEIWKDIPQFKGYYQVSNTGKIKSIRYFKEKILKPSNRKGYLGIILSVNNKRKSTTIHQIVGKVFVKGYKKGLEINHKDGNKLNNNDWNLEWTTRGKNLSHKFKVLGVINKGGLKRLKIKQLNLTGTIINTYKSIQEAYRKTKIDPSQI